MPAVETVILLVIVAFVILAAYGWRARARSRAESGGRPPEPIQMPSQAHPIAPAVAEAVATAEATATVEAAATAAVVTADAASEQVPITASTDGRRADGSRGSY